MDPKLSYPNCLNLFLDDVVHPVYKASILRHAMKCELASKRFEIYACLGKRAHFMKSGSDETKAAHRDVPFEWVPCLVRVASTADAPYVAGAFDGLICAAAAERGAVLPLIDQLYLDRESK